MAIEKAAVQTTGLVLGAGCRRSAWLDQSKEACEGWESSISQRSGPDDGERSGRGRERDRKGVESERLRRERERRASSRRRWRSERRQEAGVKLEMKLDRRKEEGGVMVRGSKGDAISSSQQQEPGEARHCV